jgi:hypothetical protein
LPSSWNLNTLKGFIIAGGTGATATPDSTLYYGKFKFNTNDVKIRVTYEK